MSGLIWVQTVCKGYQHTTKVAASRERVNVFDIVYIGFVIYRFWHSTTAYGIANETSSGDLPKVGHSVYKWPSDLLKPTLVLFLTVSEDVRKQRLSDRGIVSTFEEKSLDKDQLFRQRLVLCICQMTNTGSIEVFGKNSIFKYHIYH